MTKPTGRPRGGARPGSGPKPIGSAPGRYVSVLLPPEVEAELIAGLRECPACIGHGTIRDGETDERRKCLNCGGAGTVETLSDLLRDGGQMLVRSRRSE